MLLSKWENLTPKKSGALETQLLEKEGVTSYSTTDSFRQDRERTSERPELNVDMHDIRGQRWGEWGAVELRSGNVGVNTECPGDTDEAKRKPSAGSPKMEILLVLTS
ncbi:hypothetical protein CLCR_11054 [Cladophialophora carrionii]|uniref:Uncharacterized protein n=1 Tax=Cladophialophora carrionii TaxID=86049 RepID=A0A1C1CZG5_9EURO|nr:hypothetical protein CLCR_11054 [Cladophialophora carrionii]